MRSLNIQNPNFRKSSKSTILMHGQNLESSSVDIPPAFLKFELWNFSGCWALKFGILTALLLCPSIPIAAQNLLLSGATVHTISGETLPSGKVFIQNGKITAVGSTAAAGGARVVELSGQHLYPGMI